MKQYNPHSPEFAKTGVPFGELAELRREGRMSVTSDGSWYLCRRDDIDALLKDVTSFRSDQTVGTGVSSVDDVDDNWLFLGEITPPEHRPVRRAFVATLSKQRTTALAPSLRDVCERLVDAFDTSRPVNLQTAYAMPIPARAMAQILDLPEEVSTNFIRWAEDGSILFRPGCPAYGPEGPEVDRWFLEMIRQHKAGALKSPVFELFLQTEVNGEPLTDERIVAQLHTLVLAGVHTTRTLILHTVQRMLFDPELFEMLRQDRSLIPAFIEESLRHDSPAQRVTRRALVDVEVAGVQVKRGELVEVGIASGNRDEKYVDDPETFRLDRPDPHGHVAFGGGAHVCPGAGLARLEAATAISTLLDRVAEMHPVQGHEYPPIPCSFSYVPVPAVITLA